MKNLITLSSIVLLSACSATYQQPLTVEPLTKANHNKTPSLLLNSAKKQLLLDGYQIQVIDNEAGIISTSSKTLKLSPTEADCGQTMGLDYLKDKRTKTDIAINIIISKSEIIIKSNIQGEYKPGAVEQNITLSCVSKGKVENDLLNKLLKA